MTKRLQSRIARLRRGVFRLPLHIEPVAGERLWRAAARLLGVEWIVLDTIGRRSGHVHTVVLDVVGRDRARDVFYVQPADGRRCAWVHNVAAHPHVAARLGARRMCVRVRDATGPEGAAVVLHFLRAHPWYGRLIVWFVGYVERIDRPDAELLRDLAGTPVFALEVVGAPR
jgi:deazaflavin-dependent oxidoreductase (nitroreductase family)